MKQSMKRLISLILCFVMVMGLMPVFVLNADAAETPLAAAIFASDIHETSTGLTGSGTSAMKSVLSAIGTNGVTYDTIGFVGDTFTDIAGAKADMTSAAQTVLGQNAEVFYAWGDHDAESDISSESGLLYTGDYHYIYHISDADMRSKAGATASGVESAISAFETAAASMDKSRVLFIMSHVPLHDRRDDNTYANDWYTAIKAVADTMEVVFFWAHNHTSENDVDRAAYYVARDGSEQITIYNGDTVTPNFTYMNAGYIYAAGQNPSRKGVATTVEIYADSLVFQDYSSGGEYTDSSYSHNVTVAREFTDTVDSGSTEETTTPTTEATEPSTEATEPSTEATEPSTEATEPSTEATEPSTEATEPSTEATEATEPSETGTVGVEEDVTVPGTAEQTTTTKVAEEVTVYKLVSAPESGKQYLIVNSNDGNGYGLDGDTTGYVTTAFTGGSDYYSTWDDTSKTGTAFSAGSDVYLSTSGAYLWTAGTDSFSIGYDSDGSMGTLVTNYTYTLNPADGTSGTWTLSNDQLSISLVTKDSWFGSDTNTTYYLSGGSTWSMSTTAANVYFYEPVTIYQVTDEQTTIPGTSDTTYHMNLTVDGNAVSNHAYTVTGVTEGTTAQMNAVFTTTADGTTTTLDGYPAGGSFTLSSSNEAVATIGSDGVLTFTGVEGETLIQVDYTWTVDGVEYTTRNYVTVTAKAPVYALEITEDSASVKIGATAQLTAAATADGTAIADAEITWTSSDETIATVDADGVVTGKAAGDVIITATYTDSNGTVHTDTAAVEVVDAVYALDICKKTENADGTATFESITAPIVIKGVTNGMTHSVWAVITADGEDIGALDEEGLKKLTFTSSNEAIATVDKTTGTVIFTGEEGTVNITASYEYADGKFVTDTVTFSVTATQYTIPSDGTDDFPEYPNEGAIRFDKTATAVGTFSNTGIAQVELSMTGVPYTTGSEIDVVVMLDMTGSMSTNGMEAAELATIAFVEKIVKNEDGTYNENRVAVYAFNSGSSSPYELVALGAIADDTELATATTAIKTASDKQASGGTPYDEAAKQCYDVLQAAKTDGIGNDRQQFCVFMSDGGPTTYYGSDQKTYYGGNNNSGDVLLTSCMSGYSSSTSSDWSFTLPTEYYTDLLKADGVTVYTVGLLLQTAPSNPAPYSSMTDSTYDSTTDSLTSIGSHYYFCSSILKQMASSEDKYIDIFNVDNASKATAAFESIAKSILQAATDVTVEDKITDEYTMIFDIPTGSVGIEGLDSQEFYIEFVKYTLDENNERAGDGTSVTRLYLKNTDGVYSAASDAAGTAYAAPVFENKTLGDKGTLYYWTTDSSYASTAAVSYSDGTNTYYFVPYGITAADDGYDSAKWFNMTSGGYATGTVDPATNMSEDLLIATPYFVYNAKTRMLYWTVDKLDTEENALRYFLYLDNSATEVGTADETASGPYPTNEYAYLTYTNFNKKPCRQEYPIPQLTWNGAQVSYVFYLVNEAGQPINKSGYVVDFANATFITDVFTEHVVWNKDGSEGDTELNVGYLADELLPDDYVIYDEKAEYTIHVYQNSNGDTVFDYFIIDGSAEGTTNAVNGNVVNSDDTTKVYNTKAGAKYSEYGTYSASVVGTNFESTDPDGNEITVTTTHQASLDYSDTTVAFAVLWKKALVPDVVVVDYGLDVLINVVENDFVQNTVSGIGLGNTVFANNNINMNTGVYNTGADKGKLGTAPLTTADGSTISLESETSIRFHQNDMTFTDEVTFYYESPVVFYENSNVQEGYMYSSVTVIPATTIYYEDSFVDLTIWDNKDNLLSDVWETVGTASADTQDQDRPGKSQISEDMDADNIYGYDSAYTDCAEYSMGTARKVTVDTTRYAEAQFTFYGTGFDVISLTSNTTGTITVDVYDADEFAASPYGNTVKTAMVDTYYGYTQDEDGNWIVDTTATDSLYQVPVMKINELPYDKYTVVITVAYYAGFDHRDAGSLDFYLDAIRIYDPTGNESDTVNGYYVKDHEGWPVYQELRNNVIDSANAGQIAGAVYIDGSEGTDIYAVSDYTSFGPNNELYLAPGQAVAFSMNLATVTATLDRLQIAMKSANGGEVSYCIFDAESIEDQGDVATLKTNTIATSTDLYCDITELKESTVVIMNISENEAILSITNLKATFTADPGDLDINFSVVDEAALNALLTALNTAAPEAGESTESTESTEGTEDDSSGSDSTIGQIIDWLRKLLGLT